MCNKQDVDKETQNYGLTNSLCTDGAPEAVRLRFSCKMVAILIWGRVPPVYHHYHHEFPRQGMHLVQDLKSWTLDS